MIHDANGDKKITCQTFHCIVMVKYDVLCLAWFLENPVCCQNEIHRSFDKISNKDVRK